MKFFLLVCFGLLMINFSYAQGGQWTVKTGENIKEALGDSVIFRYSQFMEGSVYFRNETVSTARLNLNLINGEMQFINPSNDTMTVNDEVLIKYIAIQADTFYFDKVYVELVHSNAAARLAKLEVIKPVDFRKAGAYDQSSSVSSINSASFFYSNNNPVSKLNEKKSVTLHKQTVYFIGDKHNHFLPAYKKNIYQMFNKKKPVIETFIKENKIELTKKDDLVKLIDFLETM